ncbi:MAG: class I SAM-dependent methyltransferase [Candidatus Omnitrophica bacterium]|nr:class I SAM-dependent methyltransferase [Candidatus Omnitrophota bacterium]
MLDLACLEGHYGLEFALHGAEVVGIEIRKVNLAKSQFVKNHFRLDNFKLYEDNVCNLSKEKYGTFDVVICSGILYHLDAPDVFNFVKNIYEVCNHLVIFDTFISLNARESIEFEGKTYCGLKYVEHAENSIEEDKNRDLWSSADNNNSFWLTQPSLSNLLANVGFTSFCECHLPAWSINMIDRKTYVAIKGKTVALLSSPITSSASCIENPEHQAIQFAGCQKSSNFIFKFVKKTFPQPIKDVIKFILRSLRLMAPDPTPAYLKKYLKKKTREQDKKYPRHLSPGQ